jgi:hypothetical protein
MLYIKKFIDKVSLMESKMNKDLVVSMTDARGLRDELSKLLTDLHELQSGKSKDTNEVIQVEIVGGKFK